MLVRTPGMNHKRWLGALFVLIFVVAVACSSDDSGPTAVTPDVTAAPDTDSDEPGPGEATAEFDQPTPTEEADEAEADTGVPDDAGRETEPQDAEPEITEQQEPEPKDAEQADLEVVEPEAESALEQLRRSMAAAAQFGGLAPTLVIVEELRRNAERFSYEIGTPGGTLTTATISKPLTFNLVLAVEGGSSRALSYLFEGLTQTSWLTDEVEPELAESWESSDDGLRWVFHLRDDVRWHDGAPFTAQDVEFTFNDVIYNDDIEADSRALFEFRNFNSESGEWEQSQMRVRALDDYTVEFVLPYPFAPFLRSMGTAIYPKHILEVPLAEGTFNEFWTIDTDPAEIIGTGPFTIAEYTPGERIVYERNPDYWLTDGAGNRLPYLDRVVRLQVEDFEEDLELFRDGVTDFHGVLGEKYELLASVSDEENFDLHRRGAGFGTTFLVFNQNARSDDTGEPYLDPIKLHWFQNVAFRQAVAHSVDKEAIIEGVLYGLGYPQWSSISPAAADFHNPNVRRYPYDIERANEILDGLGWLDTDGDGVREDDRGNPISFRLVTSEGNSLRVGATRIIEEGLTALGLDAQVELVPFGEMVAQLSYTFDWEAMVLGHGGGPDPYSGIAVWHSSGEYHEWNPHQPEPATEWEARVDELYVKASAELDHDKRVQLYWEAQAIIAENVPMIFTTLSERLGATRRVLGNTTPTLFGFWDIRYLYRTDL